MTQKNDFKNANFYGNTQIVNGDVHNVHTQDAPDLINEKKIATYTQLFCHVSNLEKSHYDGLADMG